MNTLTIPHEAPNVHQLDSPVCALCGCAVSLIPIDGYSAYYKLDADADIAPYDDPYAIPTTYSFVWPQDDCAWLSCSYGCLNELNLSTVDQKTHGAWMFNKALAKLSDARSDSLGEAA